MENQPGDPQLPNQPQNPQQQTQQTVPGGTAAAPQVEQPQSQPQQNGALQQNSGNPGTGTLPHEHLIPEADTQRYNAELQQSGNLSEASYAELEKRGFPRSMVESYVRGLLAQQQDAYAAAYEVTGGKEQFDAMMAWAAKTLTAEQKNTFNGLLGSSDGPTVKMGLEKLNEMYRSAVPQSPGKVLTGNSTIPAAGDVYASRAEMAADMAKSEYWSNPAEQRRVAEKIQRSQAAGIKLG